MGRFALFILLAACATSQTRTAHRPKRGSANRTVQPAPLVLDAAAINDPNQPETYPGLRGSAVLRAQILLSRAHFSCGEMDANFGTNLQKTVAAFQNERHLPVSANLDAATWAALNADTSPVLFPYEIAPEDELGPFLPIPRDLMKQAELPSLSYSSPLEELSEKFHTSPEVMKALNRGVDFSRSGLTLTVPNVVTLPPGDTASVVVSKSESSVRAYDRDGKLLAFYVATIGSQHDPLPIGNWKVTWMKRNPDFHYDARLFWDAKHKDERAVIPPGPNNPVGVVWIDLSKEHYGIHGTPEPSQIGHTTSHGCIRLTNWDASELAYMVKPGIPAILKE